MMGLLIFEGVFAVLMGIFTLWAYRQYSKMDA